MSHKIIEMLIEYELTVSRLYRICSKKFPDHARFWLELAEEEENHASRIRMIAEEAQSGYVDIDDEAFAVRPLEICIENAEEIGQRVLENKANLLAAFSLSYDIESSLIESEYHRVFKGDSIRFNEMIGEIHMESVEHRRKIKERMDMMAELGRPPVLERWD